jgi:hypothetical protein
LYFFWIISPISQLHPTPKETTQSFRNTSSSSFLAPSRFFPPTTTITKPVAPSPSSLFRVPYFHSPSLSLSLSTRITLLRSLSSRSSMWKKDAMLRKFFYFSLTFHYSLF